MFDVGKTFLTSQRLVTNANFCIVPFPRPIEQHSRLDRLMRHVDGKPVTIFVGSGKPVLLIVFFPEQVPTFVITSFHLRAWCKEVNEAHVGGEFAWLLNFSCCKFFAKVKSRPPVMVSEEKACLFPSER
jgi:hypothetical protein